MASRWCFVLPALALGACFNPDSPADADTDGGTSSGGVGTTTDIGTTTGMDTSSSGGTTTTSVDASSSTAAATDSSSSGDLPAAMATDDVYFWVQGDTSLVVQGEGGVLSNDTPDGDVELDAVDLMTAFGGTISTEPGGGFTYDAPDDFWGRDAFSYTIADGAGNTSTATVTIWVRPVVAPVAAFATYRAGFSFLGDAGDLLGGDVRAVGDWNGDGIDDLGVVANLTALYGEGSAGSDNEGPAYVIFGGPYPGDLEPSDLENNQGGFAISPTVSSNGDPGSIVGGDFNGDGMGDLVINTPFYNLSGRTWMLFGDQGTTSFAIESWDYDAQGAILGLLGGSTTPMANLGDFDGDGDDEFAYSGCRVVWGADPIDGWMGADLPAGVGFTVSGRDTCRVEPLADVDGDGNPELLMYAFDAESPPRAWVLWSNDGQGDTTLDAIEADGAGYAIFDSGAGALFGPWHWVSGGGDVDGDGRGDVLINATNVLAIGYGKDTTGSQNAVDFHGGLGGFRINTPGVPPGAARIVGDMNGDGRADIAITDADAQRVYVLYGGPAAQRDLPETDGDGVGGFIVDGAALGSRLRTTSGDFNGDGLADLAVGAQDSFGEAGAVYVVYGVRTVPAR